MTYLAIAAGLLIAAFVADRLALWAERRGWLYWRRSGQKGGAGNALLDLDVFVNPGASHVVEARREQHIEVATIDGPPKPPLPDR